MFEYLAAPGFQPFSIAGLVLIGLCAVEAVGLLFGHSLSGMVDAVLGLHPPDLGAPETGAPDAGLHLDAHLDAHAGVPLAQGSGLDLHGGTQEPPGNPFGTFYDWLNAGRVPLLILLMAGLGAFAVSGLALQTVAMHVVAPLPTLAAALIAFLAVIPTTRFVSRLIATALPRDESYAIDERDLIGCLGVVTLGPVEARSAGRAKVQDKFGNAHFPRVRAARQDLVIQQGVTILVVDRVENELTVVPAKERQLEKAL